MTSSSVSSKVSILMPVRNAEPFIASAIESILNQTHENFELIIVDDGSTDSTSSVVKRFSDLRIKLIEGDERKGISFRLNQAFDVADGEFIARMDGDDLAVDSRLEDQVRYLNAHPEVSILGGGVAYIDAANRVVGQPRDLPLDDSLIKFKMLTGNCIFHPTVMLRRDDFMAHRYATDFEFSQDYELWLRVGASKVFANLPKVLTLQRKHSESVSSASKTRQRDFATLALRKHIQARFNAEISSSDALSLIDPLEGCAKELRLSIRRLHLLREWIEQDFPRKRSESSDFAHKVEIEMTIQALRSLRGVWITNGADRALKMKYLFLLLIELAKKPLVLMNTIIAIVRPKWPIPASVKKIASV